MREVLVICAALLTAQCAAAPPTVEQVNAQRAKVDADCRAKGYAPGTQDYQTCLSIADAQQVQSTMQGAALAGATLGLSTLLSDARAKRDIEEVATLPNGIHLYRFRYRSGEQVWVGVLAQDVQRVMPHAVIQGPDGLLRVNYGALGLTLMTWQQWTSSRPRVER